MSGLGKGKLGEEALNFTHDWGFRHRGQFCPVVKSRTEGRDKSFNDPKNEHTHFWGLTRFSRLAMHLMHRNMFLRRAVTSLLYKVVQIWPGLIVCKQVTVCPGHIWTTLYMVISRREYSEILSNLRLKITHWPTELLFLKGWTDMANRKVQQNKCSRFLKVFFSFLFNNAISC